MAWSWSHTAEAYVNARAQIQQSPRDWLEVCWAENQAAVRDEDGGEPTFDARLYEVALAKAKRLPSDALADDIWARAEAMQRCDNGGFNAWCCPWACHAVPFDPPAILADS